MNQKLTRKPTFGEKEFLRITTPKPLIRYHSQTPSDFDESLGFSPNKSSEISPSPSLVPSLSGTGLRSQVIAEILMKRERQVVFPKNSKFQACVTPSNYSTSSVETHSRNRKDISPIDSCQNGTEDESQKLTRKPTFGEKEFLRITTPKPLIRYHSQTPSDFDESLGFSPNKSSEISPSPSLVPSLSGTGLRSQVIAEILMKRERQVVFPKNSKFQACVTPSNYSTSSVETHSRNRKDISPIDSCQNGTEDESQSELSQLRRMPSKPSITRIGPFISG